MKPERWSDPSNKLFPHQVGFTSPPHDFDARRPTSFDSAPTRSAPTVACCTHRRTRISSTIDVDGELGR